MTLKLPQEPTLEIRPQGNMLLIRPEAPVTETSGGLALPEAYVGRPASGHVLVVGPGPQTFEGRQAPPLAPGDHIMFNKSSGWRFRDLGGRLGFMALDDEYNEEDVLLVDYKDVLCVLASAEIS